MKKKMFFMLFLCIVFNAYSQTWISDGGDTGVDRAYSIITRAEFERLLALYEQTSAYVALGYTDNGRGGGGKVINGKRPDFDGHYYLSVTLIPKTDIMKTFVELLYRGILMYGNTETGLMTIAFLHEPMDDTISLILEKNEYNRKLHEITSIIHNGSGEKYAE